jgi:predicted Zn-dependent protease
VTGQAALFAVGACIEFVGIVLLGFPDFRPWTVRLSRWLRVRARQVANRLRRLFGLPPRPTFVDLKAAIQANSALRLSVTRAAPADATLEEKVDFLLGRDQEAQSSVNTLTDRVAAIEAETPRQLDRLRDQMETHVTEELAAARDEYRPLRIAGTIALAIGLTCMSVASFV